MRVFRGRAGAVATWALTLFETLTMGLAGVSKFASAAAWQARFVSWGYPARFAFVIGAVEVAGALLLLVPRLSLYAAGLLACVMVAASATVLMHPGQLTWVAASAHLVILSLIIALRIVRRSPAPH